MAKSKYMVGSIDLSSLNGAHLSTTVNGEQSIVIPIKDNPSIFVGSMEKGGHFYLDIEVRENSQPQYGNTHFVRLSVGKKRREELGITNDSLKEYTSIIGNLKIFEAKVNPQDDDLPEA